jgi:hypothetical protein
LVLVVSEFTRDWEIALNFELCCIDMPYGREIPFLKAEGIPFERSKREKFDGR